MERDYSRLEGTAFARGHLRRLTALVVGAGALGNEVIKQLALLGVGRLIVVDRDHIERSNLTRSVLFCTPDIEQHIERHTPKAAFAAHRAREINADVETAAYVAEIADVGLTVLRGVDVIFGCLDSELARLELGWAALRANRLMVDGGLSVTAPSSGMVALYPGAAGPCYACRLAPERRRSLLWELQGREDPCWLRERQLDAAGAVASTPLTAAVVAALQVEAGLRAALDGVAPATVGLAHRVRLHPTPSIENRTFGVSPLCSMHNPADVVDNVTVGEGRSSDTWRIREVLDAVLSPADGGVLALDWPMTVRAHCETCAHGWEPMVRRGRFRRMRCPACDGATIAEREVISEIGQSSPWADRTLTGLGLPRGHVHSIVASGSKSGARTFVVAGDDLRSISEGGRR